MLIFIGYDIYLIEGIKFKFKFIVYMICEKV